MSPSSSLSRSSLSLFASLLRLHRSLPPALRSLGDQYVKDEFRRHRKAQKEFLPRFEATWAEYRDQLRLQILQQGVQGHPLREKLDEFSEEQLGQLHALKEETKKIGTS